MTDELTNENQFDYNVDDYKLGSRDILNLPTHGNLPKWLQDMSETVLQNCKKTKINRFYCAIDANALKDGVEIPSKLQTSENCTANKRYIPARYGRRSLPLATQFHAQATPPHVKLFNSEYLVPKFEGDVDFSRITAESHQSDLQKQWKSLNNFAQTQKGRLGSADSFKEVVELDNTVSLSPIVPKSSSHINSKESNMSYFPSFYHQNTNVTLNEVPYYVYSNIRKATERGAHPTTNKTKLDEPFAALSLNKSRSTEDISVYSQPWSNESTYSYGQRARNFLENYLESYPNRLEELNVSFRQDNIEKHLIEYKTKVDNEKQSKEQLINELLAENERISERLRHRTQQKHRILRSPSLNTDCNQRKMYSRLKYKSIRGLESENFRRDNVGIGDLPDFVIPELPNGKILTIDILSTWGDKHYVGLNGIEVFGSDGNVVPVETITASPADVNILPENANDPRVVSNLLDGVNRTQDDIHLWLAPFDEGSRHIITIEFQAVTTLAMIRIWNYNKSRIHSFRGVRSVILTLDDTPIFKGEIARACGSILGSIDAFGDTILFTIDDNILEFISQNDGSYTTLITTSINDTPRSTDNRPPTAATNMDRPLTGVPVATENENNCIKDQILLGANRMDIILLSNWGNANKIGLNGVQVVGASNTIIEITEENMSCSKSGNSINLGALVNDINVTTDLDDMWQYICEPRETVVITVTFDTFVYISGLRIWNYNESPEVNDSGVRTINIVLDGQPLVNPITKDNIFLLRRAPGNLHYDFVQDVRFTDSVGHNQRTDLCTKSNLSSLNLYKNDEVCVCTTMPEGFVFQFMIFSTWGDQYYCGLNGIELYDECGGKIILEEQNICAYPESINILPGVTEDVRTPDKLIDGINQDNQGAHSWLAPIVPKCLNRIYIVLDQPITISLIKLWNYSKTPCRGTKEFAVLVDDLLVYNGILDKHSEEDNMFPYRTILFSDNKIVSDEGMDSFIETSLLGQDIVLLNENRTTTGGSLPNPDQTLRPFTSVSVFDKGYTSR